MREVLLVKQPRVLPPCWPRDPLWERMLYARQALLKLLGVKSPGEIKCL